MERKDNDENRKSEKHYKDSSYGRNYSRDHEKKDSKKDYKKKERSRSKESLERNKITAAPKTNHRQRVDFFQNLPDKAGQKHLYLSNRSNINDDLEYKKKLKYIDKQRIEGKDSQPVQTSFALDRGKTKGTYDLLRQKSVENFYKNNADLMPYVEVEFRKQTLPRSRTEFIDGKEAFKKFKRKAQTGWEDDGEEVYDFNDKSLENPQEDPYQVNNKNFWKNNLNDTKALRFMRTKNRTVNEQDEDPEYDYAPDHIEEALKGGEYNQGNHGENLISLVEEREAKRKEDKKERREKERRTIPDHKSRLYYRFATKLQRQQNRDLPENEQPRNAGSIHSFDYSDASKSPRPSRFDSSGHYATGGTVHSTPKQATMRSDYDDHVRSEKHKSDALMKKLGFI